MSQTATDTEPVLLEETEHGVRILRLNRPKKKNALSTELTSAIVRAVEEAAADDAIRVVGITGVGDAFCSGADLNPGKRPPGGSAPAAEPIEEAAVRLVTGIRVGCEKPVVAGIGGIAIGAGLSLAMCADMRIASSSARFHPGYARAGTSPDCGLSWTLPRAIGHERAMRFLLELEMIDADAALALGLVGEVVPAADFEGAFLGYCQRIAEVAPLASRQTKSLVTRVGLLDDVEAHLREELRLARRGLASADGKEAVRAIMEKRKPEFKGS
ncbi:MAG: enoyl-CoA hydratase/isomerase family protein [Myxococcota bacterium]